MIMLAQKTRYYAFALQWMVSQRTSTHSTSLRTGSATAADAQLEGLLMARLKARVFLEEIRRPMVSGLEFVWKSAPANYNDTRSPPVARARRSGKDAGVRVHAEPGRFIRQFELVSFRLPEGRVGPGVAILKVAEATESLDFVSIRPPSFDAGDRPVGIRGPCHLNFHTVLHRPQTPWALQTRTCQ